MGFRYFSRLAFSFHKALSISSPAPVSGAMINRYIQRPPAMKSRDFMAGGLIDIHFKCKTCNRILLRLEGYLFDSEHRFAVFACFHRRQQDQFISCGIGEDEFHFAVCGQVVLDLHVRR